ncbi:MAG: LacI family DNA-binding transcriptional regulator [Anaerolineae bacterium]
MSVTRRQVAQFAGVSESTVSYVINNGPRSVSEETRQRVLHAIAELGYRPNVVAQNLRRQQSSTMGLIVPDTANPFYGEIARVVENACDTYGYTVMLGNSGGSPTREQWYVEQLILNQVAGIFFIPTGDQITTPPVFTTLKDVGMPTIVVDHPNDLFPFVTSNQVQIGYLATQHLLDLGHRRIAYIGRPAQDIPAFSRYTGYVRALEEHCLTPDPALLIRTGEHPEDGYAATMQLLGLEVRPTAIFAHNDMNALGVLRAAQEVGLSVPHDLSVIGSDNIHIGEYFTPPLTTIAHPIEQLAMTAVERLIDMIEAKGTLENHSTILLEPSLVVRSSTTKPDTTEEC